MSALSSRRNFDPDRFTHSTREKPLSLDEVAKLCCTGAPVQSDRVRRWIAQGVKVRGWPERIRLKVTQLPRGVGVRRSDLDAFLDQLTTARLASTRARQGLTDQFRSPRPPSLTKRVLGTAKPREQMFRRCPEDQRGKYPPSRFSRSNTPAKAEADAGTGMDAAVAGRIGSGQPRIP